MAIGRTPNLSNLGLEAAGVRVEKGKLVLNKYMQTTNAKVSAAGDCTGSPFQMTHNADGQGRAVVYNTITPYTCVKDYDKELVPSCVYTEP